MQVFLCKLFFRNSSHTPLSENHNGMNSLGGGGGPQWPMTTINAKFIYFLCSENCNFLKMTFFDTIFPTPPSFTNGFVRNFHRCCVLLIRIKVSERNFEFWFSFGVIAPFVHKFKGNNSLFFFKIHISLPKSTIKNQLLWSCA